MFETSVAKHKEDYYITPMRRFYFLPYMSCRDFSFVHGQLGMSKIFFNKRFGYTWNK